MSKEVNWKERTTRPESEFTRVVPLKKLIKETTEKRTNKMPISQIPLNRIEDPSCEFM
jgi:hypothetical protein